VDAEKSSVFRIDSSGGADLPKSQGVTFSVHSDCHADFSEERTQIINEQMKPTIIVGKRKNTTYDQVLQPLFLPNAFYPPPIFA